MSKKHGFWRKSFILWEWRLRAMFGRSASSEVLGAPPCEHPHESSRLLWTCLATSRQFKVATTRNDRCPPSWLRAPWRPKMPAPFWKTWCVNAHKKRRETHKSMKYCALLCFYSSVYFDITVALVKGWRKYGSSRSASIPSPTPTREGSVQPPS